MFFGPVTEAALIKWQVRLRLSSPLRRSKECAGVLLLTTRAASRRGR
jgi:hypothetical protein